MTSKTVSVTDALYDYIVSTSLQEPEILQQLRTETATLPQARMQIAPEQGQFMALLVRLMNAKKALEVGVFTGYSSISVALALPNDGKLIACDVSEEYTAIARRYWHLAKVDHKIELNLAPAIDTLDRLLSEGQAGTFDFAFIDADKGNYENYYDRAFELIRPGGLIAIDNVFWGGSVADSTSEDKITQTIRAFNAKVTHDDRVIPSFVAIADGLLLTLKK